MPTVRLETHPEVRETRTRAEKLVFELGKLVPEPGNTSTNLSQENSYLERETSLVPDLGNLVPGSETSLSQGNLYRQRETRA